MSFFVFFACYFPFFDLKNYLFSIQLISKHVLIFMLNKGHRWRKRRRRIEGGLEDTDFKNRSSIIHLRLDKYQFTLDNDVVVVDDDDDDG